MATKTKNRKRLKATGNCYEAAANAIVYGFRLSSGRFVCPDDFCLVHGVAIGSGKIAGARFGHAWVEFADGEIVFDAASGKFAHRDVYYRAGQIRESECVQYTRQEALRMLNEHEHFGPWHELPEGVL